MIDTACLINLNARIYDPTLGRVLSADSFVPDALDGQSYNRYAYVTNNPLAFSDPTGHGDNCDGKDASSCAYAIAYVTGSRLGDTTDMIEIGYSWLGLASGGNPPAWGGGDGWPIGIGSILQVAAPGTNGGTSDQLVGDLISVGSKYIR